MKTILILFTFLFSAAVFGNEIRVFQGEKVVMFKKSTSLSVEAVLRNRNLSDEQMTSRLNRIFKSETLYCKIAGMTLAHPNRPAKDMEARCNSLLFEGAFTKELVMTKLEEEELSDLHTTLSQYFTLLLLF